MSALRLILEDFEVSGASPGAVGEVRSQQEQAAAYAEGYAAGTAAAAEKQQQDSDFFDTAAAQLNDVISNLPTHLNQQLGEALAAVMQKVLPALAEEGFAQESATAILKHTDLKQPGSVVVKVSKERAEQLTEAFVQRGFEQVVNIEVDPELTGSTIAVFWKNGGLEMDVDMAVQKSLECLENFVSQPKEEKTDE
ncbi:MAG: hypothetical protein JKX88_09940 [Marinicaulis sp.]|nr:hypothetical protein [Marinicaulis sp.]